MARMTQGENFDEAPIVGVDGQPIEENGSGGDPTPTPPTGPKFGPKQIAIGAGIGLVVIIIAIVLFSHGGSGDDTNSDASTASVPDVVVGDDGTVENPLDKYKPTVDMSTPTEQTPVDQPGGGDTVTDPYLYCFYTAEQVEALRGYGYTGDEIEYNSQQMTPYATLVTKAQEEFNKKYEEWRQSVLDEASPGYLALMEKTYLSGTVTASTCDRTQVYNYGTKTENVDYDKCGVYTYQPWIKVHTSIGDLIMTMELPRYTELADSGNIVVSFDYAIDKAGNILYVTSVKERTIR